MADKPKTGWPPGLLQDDCRKLSRWFASRPDARRCVRERCAEIRSAKRTTTKNAHHSN